MKRMERFQNEFAKWMRGDVLVIDDADLSPEQISANNLVLFGDPGSNQVLASIIDSLPPLEWTEEGLKLAGQDYDVATNLPVLIYPNPLNPDRYVVVNSGHTFGEAEYLGTNALLFPRLGDWAVLSTADESTVAAGFFDEQWR
jgi:hypothetical protein